MASIESAIFKALNFLPAQSAFRPWWDQIEDWSVYLLLIGGVLLIPTSVPVGMPLDCTYCKEKLCYPSWEHTGSGDPPTDPGFHAYFVKKYCHFNLPIFVLYFPMILLIIAALLVTLDRPFVSFLFKSDNIEAVYKAAIKNFEYDEDVNNHKKV